MDNISAMVQAATDGKIVDFEQAFQTAMASKVTDVIGNVKSEIGSSIEIDGEE